MKIYLKKKLQTHGNLLYALEDRVYPFGNVAPHVQPETAESLVMRGFYPCYEAEKAEINWDEYREVSPEELKEFAGSL